MEFACGYTYVFPLKSAQKPNNNGIKRSALLPPKHKIRPSTPPPPPPNTSKEPKSHQSPNLGQRLEEHVIERDDRMRTFNKEPFYQNAAFHQKGNTQMGESVAPNLVVNCLPQPKQGEKKKALLPKVKSCSLPSGLDSASDCIAFPEQGLVYDLPEPEEDDEANPFEPEYSYSIPEGTGIQLRYPDTVPEIKLPQKSADLPPLPPRPSFMKRLPQYQMWSNTTLSSDSSSSSTSASVTHPPFPGAPLEAPVDKQPLPGNPNVILVTLGKIVTEENVNIVQKEPATCARCGSASESIYENLVDSCYFCQSWKSSDSSSSQPCCPSMECQDCLFLLPPESEKPKSPHDSLIIFCIDISESMTASSQISESGQAVSKPHIQYVQQALLQCVQTLSKKDPNTRVGLITFKDRVVLHGRGNLSSPFLWGKELEDRDYVQKTAAGFPSPPPLSESREWLDREIHSLSSPAQLSTSPLRLQRHGKCATGPALLVAITMASRQPGSKVVICTSSKANTKLGNLEVDDTDSHSLLPSSIFYQELGEQAANHGVTVSVLTLEGTDCRLDELGKLADRTGGRVVTACPSALCAEFLRAVERVTAATHCTVTVLLPTALCVRGEREAGHRATRDVGNVTSATEITFQFTASEEDTEALLSTGKVQIQLQVRYRRADGRSVCRVLSVRRMVTGDSALALSSTSLSILQLHVSQSCAALALRGRYKVAQNEGGMQKKLMERILDYVQSSEEAQKHREWEEIMDPLCSSISKYTRTKPVSMSDVQSLTDAGAVLFFGLKSGNRTSPLRRNGAEPRS
ncbi:circularly permutated Ras protein 1-like [Scleropages formosus]|uniref:Circularly permutated Ras protein 1-like n=1 Tax=Scleropages formosus TaxID=113540 RepID=A0A8C9RX66_SCLFO|nr:circularly permutated Ras protein 1-like [Scleropages formosus]